MIHTHEQEKYEDVGSVDLVPFVINGAILKRGEGPPSHNVFNNHLAKLETTTTKTVNFIRNQCWLNSNNEKPQLRKKAPFLLDRHCH